MEVNVRYIGGACLAMCGVHTGRKGVIRHLLAMGDTSRLMMDIDTYYVRVGEKPFANLSCIHLLDISAIIVIHYNAEFDSSVP